MERIFSLIIAATLFASWPGKAATVTSLADNGPGTLRDVIAAAAPGDTISFTVAGAITLTNGELVINKDLTIAGPGSAVLTVERSSAAGTPAFRIFHITTGRVAISGLTQQ